MAVTTTPRFGLTRWSAGTDPFRRSQLDTSLANLETYAMRGEAGPLANRPAAGIRDRYYTDDATGVTYRDSGTAWTVVGSVLAGLATVKATAGQTGNLTEWRDAAGALLATAAVDGTLTGKALAATGAASTVSPLTAQGASGQSAPLASFRNAAGTEVAAVSATGAGTFGTTAVTGTAPATSPLVVKGAASQSSNLTQWRNAANAVLASVDSLGSFAGSGLDAINTDDQPGATVVLVRGATGQTGRLTTWQDSTGLEIAAVAKDGAFTAAAGTFTAATASANPLVVKGAASQSANLAEWRNSANAALATLKADGTMTLPAAILTAPTAATNPLNVYGSVAQTGDLARFRNSAGTNLARVMADGTVDAPNLKDSGDVTTVASVITGLSANWTVTNLSLRKVGQVVDFYIFLTYVGATLATSASGDIGNVGIGTVVAAYRPRPSCSAHLGTTSTGPVVSVTIGPDGAMALSAVPPNYALTNPTAISLHGSWLTAAP